MADKAVDVELEPGFMILTDSYGRKRSQAIYPNVRAQDIPILTYEQLGQAFQAIVGLYTVLVRTLIAREVLDEAFLEEGEFTLEAITEAIAEMGGDYSDPDISVS